MKKPAPIASTGFWQPMSERTTNTNVATQRRPHLRICKMRDCNV